MGKSREKWFRCFHGCEMFLGRNGIEKTDCPHCGCDEGQVEEVCDEVRKNNKLRCPNCDRRSLNLEEKEILVFGELYDKYSCRDCSHIIVLDWRDSNKSTII